MSLDLLGSVFSDAGRSLDPNALVTRPLGNTIGRMARIQAAHWWSTRNLCLFERVMYQ